MNDARVLPAQREPQGRPARSESEALMRAALAVSRAGGADPFAELTAAMCDILGCDAGFIAVFTDDAPGMMRTLACRLDGRMLASFDYPLVGTPCEQVTGRDFKCVPTGIRSQFPPGTLFAVKGMDGYAGFPLTGATGQPLGLIVAMCRRPLENAPLIESILKIFAARIAAEIERRRAEAALLDSEASYRAIFEASEDCIFVHDWDTGRILDVSPAAERLYGYAPAEMRDLGVGVVSENVPPYTEREALALIERAKSSESPLRFEWHSRHRDGHLLWNDVTLKRATIAGKPRVLAFVRDVTERKAAEEQLRDSEERYRLLFETESDALLLVDVESLRLLDANPAAERLWGYDRQELLALRATDLSDEPESTQAAIQTRTGRVHIPLRWYRRKDGTRFPVEITANHLVLDGRLTVVSAVRDITERIRSEERLRGSEEQHRTIFNASVDGMVLKDARHNVVDANDAFLGMLGRRRDELLGRCLLDFIDPDLRARCTTLLPRILVGEPCHFEAEIPRQDGGSYSMEVHGVPMQYRGQPHALVIMRDVTDRKGTEARLRASEERYRLLFETESDAILLVDVETLRVMDANPSAEQLWGYGRADLLSLTVSDLTAEPGETRDSIRLPAGRVHIPLRWHRKRDGTVFPVEITANRLMLEGRLTVVAAVRDITARKAAEEALRASEEQYRAIFNSSADALVLRDAHFRIVDVNATYERMSGFTRSEVLGVDHVLANPPETRAALREHHDRALAGEPVVIETQLVRRDGLSRELELRAVLVRHRGEPHVLWIGRDITERKQTEEALRGSEEQYRAMFNASADALMLWNSRLQRVDVNAAHEKIFGFSREDVVGRGFEGLPYPEEMVRPRIEMVRRALSGDTCRAELEALRKDGRRIVTELRAIPFQHRGEPHVLQIARDITDRKRAEEERVRLEAQLRQAQKMEAIGQLTGGIAHDFNNILTSVVGYVVLASERDAAAADPRLLHYLDQAEQSCRRARDLIQQMLTFSRGQRGERRGVSLASLVREGAQLVRPMLPASLELQIDADAAAVVRADPVQLEQVLLNLCINARDATGGSGAIRVAVRDRDACECICASCRERVVGRYVELSVADDGPGVAPELMERIFEPFFSTKDVGKGTGMGLSVVHGIVHEHDGHVCVDTPRGGGTVFRVLLPVDAAAPDEAVVAPRPSAPARRPSLAGHVLLVDDEHAVLAFMRELLESWGLAVTPCGSAADALEAIETGGFSLVITDQTMPRMTGLQFAAEVAVRRPGLPVVLYTGYAEGLPDGGIEAAGIRALVRKPIEPAELRRAITPLLKPPR